MGQASAEPAFIGPLPDPGSSLTKALTRTDMVMLFLVLQLCQLVQPRGSLLFRKGGGFLWRWNPLTSFCEALAIYGFLFAVPVAAYESGFRGPSMAHTAGVALLLRAAEEDRFDHAYAVLQRWAEQIDPQDHQIGRQGASASIGDQHEIFWSSVCRSAPAICSALVFESLPTPEQMHAEHQIPPEVTAAINSAFGTKALNRPSIYMDVCAAAAELCVLARLFAAAQANMWFQLVAVALVVGWASVQLLTVLFNTAACSPTDQLSMAHMALVCNKTFKPVTLQVEYLHSNLYILLGCYASYLLACHPWVAADSKGLAGIVASASYVCSVFFIFFIQAMSIQFAKALYQELSAVPDLPFRHLFKGCVQMVALLWLNLAAYSYRRQIGGPVKTASGEDIYFPGIFKNGTVLHQVFDHGYSFLLKTFWIVTFATVLLILCNLIPIQDSRPTESADASQSPDHEGR